jgi:hypothetical protein
MTGEGAAALVIRLAVQEISSAKRCAPTCTIIRDRCGTAVSSGFELFRFGKGLGAGRKPTAYSEIRGAADLSQSNAKLLGSPETTG